MNERQIISADVETLDEDELDELIGSATRSIKRLESDRQGVNTLRQALQDRILALRTAQRDARAERRVRG